MLEYGAKKTVQWLLQGNFDVIIVTVKTQWGHLYWESVAFPDRVKGDVLAELVSEAHANDIKVYAGFATLTDRLAIIRNPSIQQRQLGGPNARYSNIHVSPCVESYREDLKKMLHELVSSYDIDGVALGSLHWWANLSDKVGGNPECAEYGGQEQWMINLLTDYARDLTTYSHRLNPILTVAIVSQPFNRYQRLQDLVALANIGDLFIAVFTQTEVLLVGPPYAFDTFSQQILANTTNPIVISLRANDVWIYPDAFYRGLSRYIGSKPVWYGINFHGAASADGEHGPAFTQWEWEKITSVVLSPPTVAPAAMATSQTPTPTPTVVHRPRTALDISVKGDTLQFDTDKLAAVAGTEVVLAFHNASTINQHNWVLVKNRALIMTRLARPPDFVDSDDPNVIAHTRLLDPGETGEVRFTAPPAGTYQFVCTFPGHIFTMFGDFIVIP